MGKTRKAYLPFVNTFRTRYIYIYGVCACEAYYKYYTYIDHTLHGRVNSNKESEFKKCIDKFISVLTSSKTK